MSWFPTAKTMALLVDPADSVVSEKTTRSVQRAAAKVSDLNISEC